MTCIEHFIFRSVSQGHTMTKSATCSNTPKKPLPILHPILRCLEFLIMLLKYTANNTSDNTPPCLTPFPPTGDCLGETSSHHL